MALNEKGFEIVEQPFPLIRKLGGVALSDADHEGVKKAEVAVGKLVDDYFTAADSLVRELRNAHEEMKASRDEGGRILKSMRMIAFDIKGEAGTLGYPLIGVIAGRFHEFLKNMESLQPSAYEAVDVFVNSVALAVTRRLGDDSGREGKVLIAGLDRVLMKFSAC